MQSRDCPCTPTSFIVYIDKHLYGLKYPSMTWLYLLQVRAAEEHWGAKVVVLDGVHHDVMLGPKWKVAADALASWLHEHEEQFSAAKH